MEKPTKLYTHHIDVDAINAMELAAIRSEPVQYQMQSKGNPNLVRFLKKYCMVPEVLELKKGAVVMFVKNNQSKGYVNGTLGTVIGFDEDDHYPIVKTITGKEIWAKPATWKVEEDEKLLAEIMQVPIRLAWAITVHKSQGMSLDAAEIDLSKAFAEGMGYVALSRVRSLAGIKLDGLNEMALRVNQEITALDGGLETQSMASVTELKRISSKQKKKLMKDFILEKKTVEKEVLDIPF